MFITVIQYKQYYNMLAFSLLEVDTKVDFEDKMNILLGDYVILLIT